MALYAFDGTGNKDNDDIGKDTNVIKFFETYERNYKLSDARGKCFYVSGVGTRWSFLGLFFGSIFGAGGSKRIKEAYKACQKNFNKGDNVIDIVGFSRGAALAIEFANKLKDEGVNGDTNIKIRFLGIWDTVASFGLPGNNVNLGYKLTVPENVGHCCHAIALDERRKTFPVTRVTQNATLARDSKNIHELWFRGFHSDVGGGNQNSRRSHLSLTWMMHQSRLSELPISNDDISPFATNADLNADCKKPKMDKIANHPRTVRPTDLLHESVIWVKKAGNFNANNPPDGMRMVGNTGEVLLAVFSSPSSTSTPDEHLA